MKSITGAATPPASPSHLLRSESSISLRRPGTIVTISKARTARARILASPYLPDRSAASITTRIQHAERWTRDAAA